MIALRDATPAACTGKRDASGCALRPRMANGVFKGAAAGSKFGKEP